MFPHWNYVLENLFGEVRSGVRAGRRAHPDRWDEKGEHYTATAEDAAYGIFEIEGGIIAEINSRWTVRVNRDELVEFQVDGTHGSAVVGLFGAKIQPRNATPQAGVEPRLADTRDYDADWEKVPTNDVFLNGFRQQWEEFLVSYVLAPTTRSTCSRAPRRAVRRGRPAPPAPRAARSAIELTLDA